MDEITKQLAEVCRCLVEWANSTGPLCDTDDTPMAVVNAIMMARAALAKYDTLQSTPVPTDDDPNPPKCKSCEKPWRQHLGAEGLCKQVQELKQAVRTLRSYADDTVDYWAEGRIKKVGKRLMAMSGHNPGYSASIDAALATESGENYD